MSSAIYMKDNREAYTDTDIHFILENTHIHALNIIRETFLRNIPSHSHGNGCYEIHYISSGLGRLIADGKNYPVTPNTLFITGPHVEHAQIPVKSDPMEEYCVYFHIRAAGSRKGRQEDILFPFLAKHLWFGRGNEQIRHTLTDIFSELRDMPEGYLEVVRLLLARLIIQIVRIYSLPAGHPAPALPDSSFSGAPADAPISALSGGSLPQNRPSGSPDQKQGSQRIPGNKSKNGNRKTAHVQPVNLYDSKSVIIEEYFLNNYQDLSLQDLSGRLKTSPRQTERLIREYYGKTFQQKKMDARMSAAEILLREPSRSIQSISEELGFSSSSHFSCAFSKYHHVSPGKYRKDKL